MSDPITDVNFTHSASSRTIRVSWKMAIEKNRWVWPHEDLEVRLYCEPFPDFEKPKLKNMGLDERQHSSGEQVGFKLPFLPINAGFTAEDITSYYQTGTVGEDRHGQMTYPVHFKLTLGDVPRGLTKANPALEWQYSGPAPEKIWVLFGVASGDDFVGDYRFDMDTSAPPVSGDKVDPDTAPYIFISYQRDSEAEARAIHEYLTEAGFRVWQDVHNIRHTDRWADAINEALQECDRLILLMTPASMESREVRNEWWSFYEDRKPIHTLMVETCKPFYTLRPFQYLDWRNPSTRPWERLIESLQTPYELPAVTAKEKVVPTDLAPRHDVPESLTRIKKALLSEDEVVAIHPDDHAAVLHHSPTDEHDYRILRYATWCGENYQLDERFVRLSMLLDQGPQAQQRWLLEGQKGSKRFDDLQQVLREETSPVLVLLGDPGAGKSTLLRRLEMDVSLDALRDDTDHTIPFYAPLSEYGMGLADDNLPSPYEWLKKRWETRCPNLGDFDDILQERRFLFLLDSLNEMPHTTRLHFEQRAARWQAFIQQYVRDLPGNRAIFACRTLDYGSVLSSEALTVPQLQLERMTRPQVREYLDNYAPEHADRIWDHFESDSRQFDLFSIPFMLQMLIDRVLFDGTIPEGRADTFNGFVRGLLYREVHQRKNPLFRDGTILTEREIKNIEKPPRNPYDLPERGQLIPSLVTLAYRMQNRTEGEEKGQVVVDYDDALDLLPGINGHRKQVIKAACDMTVLEDQNDQIKYFHQLLQEFFAARQLARHPDSALVKIEWHKDHLTPSLEDVLESIADSDPLPGPPTTGWEETTLLAAAMSDNPDDFVRGIMAVNLPLAGRCGAAPDVVISDTLKEELQQALLDRTHDPDADLRSRIAAGLALGELGDPRFKRETGDYGDYLMPRLVNVEGGTYMIGSDDGLYDDESPVHPVEIAPFAIGQFPVTNAEYKCFMDAGGYDDEQWWDDTDESLAWLRGELSASEQIQEWLNIWEGLQANPDQVEVLFQQNRITSEARDQLNQIAQMSREELMDGLNEEFPEGETYHEPAFWQDARFNNPNQPVVGITWFEARAYCNWLSAQTKLEIRLPREVEWEAAARGKEGRRYASGPDFAASLCNTFESHIRRTTPVDVFPDGETPDTKLVDMSGNVWEWTSSVYEDYPYVADDGREDLNRTGVRRVLRGGSWYDDSGGARAAYRYRYVPAFRFNLNGCRVVVLSPIP